MSSVCILLYSVRSCFGLPNYCSATIFCLIDKCYPLIIIQDKMLYLPGLRIPLCSSYPRSKPTALYSNYSRLIRLNFWHRLHQYQSCCFLPIGFDSCRFLGDSCLTGRNVFSCGPCQGEGAWPVAAFPPRISSPSPGIGA